jgi:peroxiredoxin Q/BCP
MKTITTALAALAFAMKNNFAADLTVGDDAPDFELKGSDGKTYKLSELKGKKAAVIAWFPKVFTGG